MGKTKDVTFHYDEAYKCDVALFTFKDDVCSSDGVVDPGANQTEGLSITGKGKASLLLSEHFFPLLGFNVNTHFLRADVANGTMLCQKLNMIPLEFIWRNKAWGSFCKTYGVPQGQDLGELVEVTLKNDELGDPRICEDACVKLGLVTRNDYQQCYRYTKLVGEVLARELHKHQYELIDFKVEFGLFDGVVKLADEISGDIWRILDKDGNPVDPITAAETITQTVICGDKFPGSEAYKGGICGCGCTK